MEEKQSYQIELMTEIIVETRKMKNEIMEMKRKMGKNQSNMTNLTEKMYNKLTDLEQENGDLKRVTGTER